MHNYREFRIRTGGPLGCLLAMLSLGGLVVLGTLVLLPLLGIALGVALGVVCLGLLIVAWWRLRAWWRRLFAGRTPRQPVYRIETIEQDEPQDEDKDRRDR